MRERSLFEYTINQTPLHRLNPLAKLFFLTAFCILTAAAGSYLLAAPALLIIILFIITGKSLLRQIPEYWKIYIFFLVSGAIKYMTTGSVYEGTAFSLKMLFMMWAGLIFYSTTRLTHLRYFLSPPAGSGALKRLSDLIVMTLAFFPMIFMTVDEQKGARYARCFRKTGSPIKIIKLSAIPLMIELFLKAEEMTDAWYSRGYSPE